MQKRNDGKKVVNSELKKKSDMELEILKALKSGFPGVELQTITIQAACQLLHYEMGLYQIIYFHFKT